MLNRGGGSAAAPIRASAIDAGMAVTGGDEGSLVAEYEVDIEPVLDRLEAARSAEGAAEPRFRRLVEHDDVGSVAAECRDVLVKKSDNHLWDGALLEALMRMFGERAPPAGSRCEGEIAVETDHDITPRIGGIADTGRVTSLGVYF